MNYLLEQVNIGNDYAQFFTPLDPTGVREVSGENNNLVGAFDANGNYVPGANPNGDWGQSDTDFLRIFAPDHPNNGTAYGVAYDPVTTQVIDSGDGTPILGADGQPLIVPADFATQFAEAAISAPGSSPRTITQLISNSDVDPASPTYNPAAHAAMVQMGGEAVPVSNSVVGTAQTAFIPDPGVLGGVPFNDFFAMFGQFFDHGLDFITKGGGFVLTPLSPSDPLYDPSAIGPMANMMMLSRGALSNPASDFDIDGFGNAVLKPDAVPAFNNNTGLLIDQSQTYGSHSTINVLLRQYDAGGNVTGKLITSAEDGNGSAHGLATFADQKANAARIGIELIDMDVPDAPMIQADAVGKVTFTPQQTILYRSDLSIAGMGASYAAANDPFVRWTQADADANLCLQSQVGYAKRTGHAIISDMGNAASPVDRMGNPLAPMGTTDPTAVPGPGQYNEALLASHYVSGDHRANENAGLTTIHHIFHEEHNIQTDAIMAAVTEQAALLGGQAEADYLAQWQTAPGVWDGEKIYQAARIITESEYNHIAIDQYVGAFVVMPEFVSYTSDINMGISLEFSQAVFRLGHSQNSETMRVAIQDGNGVNPGEAGYIPTFTSVDLFDTFLNPSFYQDNGPSGIALGLLNLHANAVDEFVTSALQQTTVGIPLDLAAIDIARGHDVGMPTLNEMRQQIFDGLVNNTSNNNTNGPGIAPYTSWEDFGGHLRHPESLVNFIAAYGREDGVFGLATMRRAYEAGSASGTDSLGAFDATAYDPTPGDGVVTLQDLRANAQVILDAAADDTDPLHEDAVLFMRGQGSPVYDPATGTWNQNHTGGGDLGFWDIDLWIGGLAEQPLFDTPLGTTFTMIMADFGQRMQDADRFYYLYRMPVGHHLGDQIIGEQFSDLIMRTTGLEHIGDAFGFQSATYILDGTSNDNPYDGTTAAGTDIYGVNDYFNAIYETLPDGGSANDGHIVVAGLEGNDYIVGALGDDYVYGDAGNDVIEGAQGNDHLYGGPGDDWITDYENDDFIHGGPGNDYISAGPGALDTSHGGDGDDEVHGGDGIDEVFGGNGDDMLFGEADTDLMFGGNGNDYMEGGDSVDEMFGGNGNEWMRGGVGDDHLNGGSGNDLLEGGLGPAGNDGDRLVGDSPIAIGLPIFEFNGDGTEGDMDIGSYEEVGIAIFANMQTANANGTSSNLLDTYVLIEGLVGSRNNDELTGADANTATSNGPNNYLIGGGGDDTLTGLGDDYGLDATTGLPAAGHIDYIFGDSVVVDNDLYWIGDDRHVASGHGNVTGTIENWKGTGEIRVVFQDGTLGHILGDNGADGADTAIYRGNSADYQIDEIVMNGQQAIRITDLRDPGDATFDGIDILVGVEFAQFADRTISDFIAPTVTIDQAAGQADPANTSPVNFTVVFSEPVADFVTGDVTLGGTAPGTLVGTVTGSGTTYNVAVTGMTGDGTVIADIAAGVAQDAAGNLNTASASTDNMVTFDATAPAPVITAMQSDPTSADPINFSVDFGEVVTGFVIGDLGIGNGTASNLVTVDDQTYTFDVSPTADGLVTVDIAGAVAQDAAGNDNNAATQFSITSDQTAPTPAITATQSDPTSADPINFSVDFGEVVSGFVIGDLGIGNGTASNLVTVDDQTYTFDVSPAADGLVTVDIAGAVAQDAVGHENNAATQFSITSDRTAPTPAITTTQSDPTGADPINFSVDFGEVVTGFVIGDLGIGNGTASNLVTVDDQTYTFDVSPTADGLVTVDIAGAVAQDAAGNDNNAATQFSITSDQTAPTPAITAMQSDPTNADPINFSVDFGEVVTGFVIGDLGIGNGTASNLVTVDDRTYTFDVSPTADGLVTVDIAGAVVQDAAGNDNNAAAQFSITSDQTAPTPAITAMQSDPTSADPINFSVDFGEVVTGFVIGDLVIGNGTASNLVTVDDRTYTFDVSPTADGLVTVDIAGAVAQDTAGNDNNAATQFSITSDQTAPTPAITAMQSDPTNADPINFSVDFGEAVTGFVIGDLVIGNGTASNLVTVDDRTYTFDVSPTADGLVTVDIAGAVAQDAAGNDNNSATQFSITSDRTAPTPAITATQSDPTNADPISFSVDFGEVVTGFVIGDPGIFVIGDLVIGNGTASNLVTVDDRTYTFDVSPTADGLVTVDIAGAVAQDAAGNDNNAATQFSITSDKTAPTVTIEQAAAQADPTSASPINFTVVFSEAVTGFVGTDVTLGGTASATTAVVSTSDNVTFNVAVSGMSQAGTVVAGIPAGVAQDAAGNLNTASTSTDNTVTFDPSDDLGMYDLGVFHLDTSGNGVWDGVAGGDTLLDFGINPIRAVARPVTGDWDGDGDDDLGIYSQGRFYLDTTQNGVWDRVSGGDTFFDFGIPPIRSTASPVIGDWDGDGDDDLGLYNAGRFYLDTTQNGAWDGVAGGDTFLDFGIPLIRATASPVIGDWDGDGDDDLGLYNAGRFYLDTTQNGTWDRVSGGDTYRDFGINSGQPVIGDWDADGDDDLGMHNLGLFFLDTNQNGVWDDVVGGDTLHDFGFEPIRATGLPLAGQWAMPSPLLAAGGPATAGEPVIDLTEEQLTPIVDQAIALWAGSGLNQEEVQRLESVEVRIADLAGARLGEALGTTITVDIDAAGYGWFVDATPGANEEFDDSTTGGLVADPSGSAADRMDLLTVVLHELGHVLGHADIDDVLADDVMNGWLSVGDRRI